MEESNFYTNSDERKNAHNANEDGPISLISKLKTKRFKWNIKTRKFLAR